MCRKSTTWDWWLYFPSEGRRAEDFFAPKNTTASAGCEPANLGTKGQHATPRPPKPVSYLRRMELLTTSQQKPQNSHILQDSFLCIEHFVIRCDISVQKWFSRMKCWVLTPAPQMIWKGWYSKRYFESPYKFCSYTKKFHHEFGTSFHRKDTPGQSLWDIWWRKWQWGKVLLWVPPLFPVSIIPPVINLCITSAI